MHRQDARFAWRARVRHVTIMGVMMGGTLANGRHVLLAQGTPNVSSPTLPGTLASASSDDVQIPATEATPYTYAAVAHLFADSVKGLHLVVGNHMVMRHDSVHAVISAMTREWIAALERKPVTGIYQLPMAQLYASVNRDTDAQRLFDARLADATLSPDERVWTLSRAIDILLAEDTVQTLERITLAKRYLTQVDAIPFACSADVRFGGRIRLMDAYVRRREHATALTWGLEAYRLIDSMPQYEQRSGAASHKALLQVAMLLAPDPCSRQRIDSLVTGLKKYMSPSASLMAKDTAYIRWAGWKMDAFKDLQEVVLTVGLRDATITAMHWYNMPVPLIDSAVPLGARILRMNDGIIRIVGFGEYECPYCREAMVKMQQTQKRLPAGVQFLWVNWTLGNWGNDQVTPAEEGEHLRHYWLERKHYTFPIASWEGPRDSTPGSGTVKKAPMMNMYALRGAPTFLIVDGQGIVRARADGSHALMDENFMNVVTQLRAEQNLRPSVTSKATSNTTAVAP